MRKNTQRDLHIVDYNKGHTLRQTGRFFGISHERVRQIVDDSRRRKFCDIHSRWHFGPCVRCLNDVYEAKLSSLSLNRLKAEALREKKNTGRDASSTDRRRRIVKVFRDKHGFSWKAIGRELDRDYTTVMYLYDSA